MEKEDVKKKINLNVAIIAAIVIILIAIIIIIVIKVLSKSSPLIANNDCNMSLAIKNEDTIFYYDCENGLIKKNKNGKKVLIEDETYYLNFYEGYIYYLTPNSKGKTNIIKINSDGKNEKIVLTLTPKINKMYLQNGKIYYTTSNPNTISRVSLDGKDEEVLTNTSVSDFKVIGNKIYYSDDNNFLNSINIEGNDYKLLINKSLFKKFQILDDYVYYFDYEAGKLMKASLSGKHKSEEVTNKMNCDKYNVTSEGIYYLDEQKSKICFISWDNKVKELVSVKNNNPQINIVNDQLYYIDFVNNKEVTKVININSR